MQWEASFSEVDLLLELEDELCRDIAVGVDHLFVWYLKVIQIQEERLVDFIVLIIAGLVVINNGGGLLLDLGWLLDHGNLQRVCLLLLLWFRVLSW